MEHLSFENNQAESGITGAVIRLELDLVRIAEREGLTLDGMRLREALSESDETLIEKGLKD